MTLAITTGGLLLVCQIMLHSSGFRSGELALYRTFDYFVKVSPAEIQKGQRLDEVLRTHGRPGFSVASATIEQPRWVLWGRFLPVRAARLVTSDLQVDDPGKRPLAGRVLIFCEGNALNGWFQLELWIKLVAVNMSRATPFLGQEEPGKTIMQVKPGNAGSLADRSLMFALGITLRQVGSGKDSCVRYIARTDPFRVTIVQVDPKGIVSRSVTIRIWEIDLSNAADCSEKIDNN